MMRSYVTQGATVSNKSGAPFTFQGKAADVSVHFKMAAVTEFLLKFITKTDLEEEMNSKLIHILIKIR